MRCNLDLPVFKKSQPQAASEEAQGFFLPPLNRNEKDHAEYLQSPKEHRGGEEQFFRPTDIISLTAILHLPS